MQLEYLKGRKVTFSPGQFINISFTDKKKQPNAHICKSFSISSSPFDEETLEIVVLDLGEFRHSLSNSPIGTTLSIEGPYGSFIYTQDTGLIPVFIAGGSGIAPIMSMLRHVNQEYPHMQFILFYTFRAEKDIIFLKELEEMKKSNKMFQCHFVSTQQTGYMFNHNANPSSQKDKEPPNNNLNYSNNFGQESIKRESGHIDESMISRNINDIVSKAYYICGPYEMMIMVSYVLQKLGVDNSNIKSELW